MTEKIEQVKFWLVKHPLSAHYKETAKQAKRLAAYNNAKIFDAKLAAQLDPARVVDHKLTPLVEEKPAKKKAAKKVANKVEESSNDSDGAESKED